MVFFKRFCIIEKYSVKSTLEFMMPSTGTFWSTGIDEILHSKEFHFNLVVTAQKICPYK